MKTKIFCLLTLVALFVVGCSKSEEPAANSTEPTSTPTTSTTTVVEHKYMFLTDEKVAELKTVIGSNANWSSYHSALMAGADEVLKKDLLQRVLTGKRLLSVSRDFFRRVSLLSYAYRMTGRSTYLARAIQEMSMIASFSDWNPSHFLDVAEMTAGMAIGYNWLYKDMNEATRTKLATAIQTKGLDPSNVSSYNKTFLPKINNWNQVCNGGITLGALALDPFCKNSSTTTFINRAVESVKLPMAQYAPDGAYPEGYSYYAYGTFYNLLLLEALKDIKGTDYDLSKMTGFLNSGWATMSMVLNDLAPFNYSDCGSSSASLDPCLFWMTKNGTDESPLWLQKTVFDKKIASSSSVYSAQYCVFTFLWGYKLNLANAKKPTETFFLTKDALNPIAVMRTSWDFNSGLALGLKSGSVSVNHAHMDIGSFVFSEENTRWAIDLGPQDYNSLESQGVDLWNMKQTSQRWEVYRYNNYAHNTLTMNGALQQVSGKATFSDYSKSADWMYATTDISSIYADQVKKVVRTAGIKDQKYAVIKDEITTADKETVVRWTMMTKAEPEVVDNKTIKLTQNSKTLLVKVMSDLKTTAKTADATPTHSYDAANTGVYQLTFETTVPANQSITLEVDLVPQQ